MGTFESKIRPALLRQHPDMTKEAVNVFKRKWEVSFFFPATSASGRTEHAANLGQYYFTYCEAGFVTKTLGDVIITVGRERTLEFMEGIPL